MSGTPEDLQRPHWEMLPAAHVSDSILIRAKPDGAGLFRYLLEGEGGHMCMLTVLDPKMTLIKLRFSPHQRGEVLEFLRAACQSVYFEVLELPFGGVCSQRASNAGPGAGMEDVL